MFEHYTEPARRAVFFARFEASQCGSDYIQLEHLLVGILLGDPKLALRLLPSREKIDGVRDRVRKSSPGPKPNATSVDLPLDMACKRALAHAAEVSQNLQHKQIHAAHLLMGIFRDSVSAAASILRENRITEAQLQEEVIRSEANAPAPPPDLAELPRGLRDLTSAALQGELGALIGRERELERVIQILSRRTKNNPVLVGETGVGKSAIVEGLAQRISNGVVLSLAERPIVAVDATTIIAPTQRVRSAEKFEAMMDQVAMRSGVILCIDGLFDLAGAGSGWAAVEAAHIFAQRLGSRQMQCIATSTPAGLLHTMQKAPALAHQFEVVEVAPPSQEETVRIVSSLKTQYEKFHGVVFGDGVIEAAVHASGRFLQHRSLPDRALDLIDEAGARVKLKREKSKEEAAATVTADDIADVVADRACVPLALVKKVLSQVRADEFERVSGELAACIPTAGQEWIAVLAAYLSRCSPAEAEKLAEIIKSIADRRKERPGW